MVRTDFLTDYIVVSFYAWCRNDGIHSTPSVGSVNWNQELIWMMKAELEDPWDILLEDEVPKAFTVLHDEMKKSMVSAENYFRGKSNTFVRILAHIHLKIVECPKT
jgi:hypothetical protein